MQTQMRRLALGALLSAASLPALACGPDSYLGTVCTVAFDFCPRGTAEAKGQLVPVSENTALFSLLGTTYGGDGRTTFGLPDLRGRSIVGVGQEPGKQAVIRGEKVGQESVTLTNANLPAQTFELQVANANGTETTPPASGYLAIPNTPGDRGAIPYPSFVPGTDTSAKVSLKGGSLGGAAVPVENRSPALGMRQCIVTEGIYPPRS